jgi:hypothetical protein
MTNLSPVKTGSKENLKDRCQTKDNFNNDFLKLPIIKDGFKSETNIQEYDISNSDKKN